MCLKKDNKLYEILIFLTYIGPPPQVKVYFFYIVGKVQNL